VKGGEDVPPGLQAAVVAALQQLANADDEQVIANKEGLSALVGLLADD
jgi:hypothetical protein